MTDDKNMSSSLSSYNLIENAYKISLKFFMNKNFTKSFDILKPQYNALFDNLKSGVIDHQLFVKILNLYLTEAGLILEKGSTFRVGKQEKRTILTDLKDEVILDKLVSIYQDINQIPSEILYNLYLIQYIGLELSDVHVRFTKLYARLNFDQDDKYVKKTLELLVLKILPELNLTKDAKAIVEENPLFDDKDRYLISLTKLENEKQAEEDKQTRLEYQKTRDQKKKEANDKLEKNLKYKSLKQIKKSHEDEETKSHEVKPNTNEIQSIRNNLLYHFNLTKKFLQKNSPILLLSLIIALFISRFLKARKVNVGQSLKETLQMAFKISYL